MIIGPDSGAEGWPGGNFNYLFQSDTTGKQEN
jgi:hypothetical protein